MGWLYGGYVTGWYCIFGLGFAYWVRGEIARDATWGQLAFGAFGYSVVIPTLLFGLMKPVINTISAESVKAVRNGFERHVISRTFAFVLGLFGCVAAGITCTVIYLFAAVSDISEEALGETGVAVAIISTMILVVAVIAVCPWLGTRNVDCGSELERETMKAIVQAMQDDYLDDCDIHQWVKQLENVDHLVDASGFYGFNINLERVSSESPYLYVAYKQGMGFFASIRLRERAHNPGRGAAIFAKQSDNFTDSVIFEADEWVLKVPRGLFIDKVKTIQVVLHFCGTGSLSPDVDWIPYEDLTDEIFADADECEEVYRQRRGQRG